MKMFTWSCKHLAAVILLPIYAVALLGCDSPTGPDLDIDDSRPLQGGSVLVYHNAAGLAGQRSAIEQVVDDTLAAVRGLIGLDNVTIIVRGGTDNVIPEIGVGGRAAGDTITIDIDPVSPLLTSAISSWLFPILAHEMHHTARMRTVGYGDDLLGAMISEGLADQFAIEVAGIAPPPWSIALTSGLLAAWSENAEAQWFDTSYSHSAWFFGTGAVPRWAGYSIGFDLVRRFLEANPSRLPSNLVAEPASSFIET